MNNIVNDERRIFVCCWCTGFNTSALIYSNVNKNTYAGWVLVTLSIPSSYAVSGNRLYFDASEDSSLQTTFYVDGVSIQ